MSPEIAAPPIEKKNYLTALKDAIRLEMQRNPDMICIGEDIGLLGGAFGVTEGLQEEFGADRVIDAPISEAAIVGSAIGMALRGRTVMVEMQFIDFISCGFDQIVNNAATMAYRTAGKASVPIVIRGPSGGYGGGGPYHSQQNEAWFAHSPGLKVVCPSTPRDAYGLMVASLRDPNPVIFYEVKDLYRKREIEEEIPEDTFVPLGSASVVREGSDITIISYGNPMHMCIKVAGMLADDGVEAELIDLRTLVPLDEGTIYRSVKKTGRVLVVNEASRTCGFAGEVIARINENCFEYLDAPPLRVTRADTPVPWVQPLELAVLPSVEQIYETALRIAKF